MCPKWLTKRTKNTEGIDTCGAMSEREKQKLS